MKVALAQLNPAADPERDCETACSVIQDLPETDLVVFPELFLGGYDTDDPASAALEPNGEAMSAVGEACDRAGTAALLGFTEPLGDGRFANSLAGFGGDGGLAGVYRKTHLFGPAERAAFTPGDGLTAFRLAGRLVGAQICFDTEFPEPARRLALAGAEMLATASANMVPYAADHRLAARARALDNRIPHLYANRVGSACGHRFVGESCVIAPDGTVLEELGRDEGILEAELDFAATGPDTSYLDHFRNDLDVIVHDNANGGEA